MLTFDKLKCLDLLIWICGWYIPVIKILLFSSIIDALPFLLNFMEL